MTFKLAPSPHTHQQRRTSDVMRLVSLALIPGILTHALVFGYGIFIQIVLALTTAYFVELLCVHARHRSARVALHDNTALVTAILLALSIPALAPWWVIVIGTAFAIAIAKHLYGGVGHNVFNPAMVGYVVLLISFPVQMTNWPPVSWLSPYDVSFIDALSVIFTGFTVDGYSIMQLRSSFDGITMATPLDALKTGLTEQLTRTEIMQGVIFSDMSGIGWQWLSLAYLGGGLYLVKAKIISWHIPLGVLLGIAIPALLWSWIAHDQSIGMMMHLSVGATMLGAFFIATDPVSAATSNRGRLIFGGLIGLLTFIIRTWGGYPDAIAFAVLLANMCVPIIDKYTRPPTYGQGKRA